MSMEEAKEDVVRILDRQTIKRVRRECERLAGEKELPQFQEFLQTGSHFIVTEKRASILRGVQQGLANRESPGVILHGAYGSGKTVLMESIAQLCEDNQEYDGIHFDQLTYGDTEIDCLQISLEQYDTPSSFLQAIYQQLVEESDSITEQDLIDVFNENDLDLTPEDLDPNLPPSRRQDLIDRLEDPSSLEDIAQATKSLTAGEAHDPITWFTSYYREQEGRYPALYIDEFEQLSRQGVAVSEPFRLKAIIQRMIRKAVSGFDDLEDPPYILFANTAIPDSDEFEMERDLIRRTDDSVNYNIDLSERETKELFEKLYRLYVIPLLADRDNGVAAWHNRISSADIGEDGYVYPFTDEALDFALRVVHTFELDDSDEKKVRAFRDYKRILITFLGKWEGDGWIDLDFLYQHGDDVRDDLRGQVERVDLDALPGADSIERTITDDFPDQSGPELRVLSQIAKVGILERTERPVYFTDDEILDVANTIEIRLREDEAADLIDVAANGPDYFTAENGRLGFDPDELTGTAAGDEGRTLPDQIQETVDDLDLEDPDVIELWEQMLDHQFRGSFDIENRQNQFLVFDTEGDLNYTNRVYLAVDPDRTPEQLRGEVDDAGLHFVIRLGDTAEDDDHPATYFVSERNDRASDLAEDIQESLNAHIESQFETDSYTHLIDAIEECYPTFNDYQIYSLFLKLSLARLAGHDLPEDIRDRTAERSSFDIYQTVNNNVTGPTAISHYARPQLGFTDSYAGQDILDLIYGIKHYDETGDLIYENPNLPYIEVRTFGQITRGRESGEGFRQIVADFADDERFIDETGSDTYGLTPSFSTQTRTVLDQIEDALAEADDGLEFDDIVNLIFGTTEVDSVTKAMLYLLLVLGDYWDDEYSWTFEDEDDSRIISSATQLTTQKTQARTTVANAIKIEILDQAKTDDPDTESVTDLKATYEQINDASDITEINDLVADVDDEWDFEYTETDQDLRGIVANDVFADTAVASYANTIRPLSEIERELVYLLHDDLQHLVAQVQEAAVILEKQDELDGLIETLSYFDIDPNLDSDDIAITCITQIEDFWETHQADQIERQLEETAISSDIEDFLDDNYDLDRLFTVLQEELRSLVPDIDSYDNTEDLETVSEDLDVERAELQETLDEELETVASERAELETYEQRLPDSESGWIRRANTYLDNCKDELEKGPDRFDHEQYDDYWDQWSRAKENIERLAIDDDEFEAAVREYDDNIPIDEVEDASEDGVADLLTDLPNETFEAVIASLDSDDDATKDLKRLLLKVRVKAELIEDSGEPA